MKDSTYPSCPKFLKVGILHPSENVFYTKDRMSIIKVRVLTLCSPPFSYFSLPLVPRKGIVRWPLTTQAVTAPGLRKSTKSKRDPLACAAFMFTSCMVSNTQVLKSSQSILYARMGMSG